MSVTKVSRPFERHCLWFDLEREVYLPKTRYAYIDTYPALNPDAWGGILIRCSAATLRPHPIMCLMMMMKSFIRDYGKISFNNDFFVFLVVFDIINIFSDIFSPDTFSPFDSPKSKVVFIKVSLYIP